MITSSGIFQRYFIELISAFWSGILGCCCVLYRIHSLVCFGSLCCWKMYVPCKPGSCLLHVVHKPIPQNLDIWLDEMEQQQLLPSHDTLYGCNIVEGSCKCFWPVEAPLIGPLLARGATEKRTLFISPFDFALSEHRSRALWSRRPTPASLSVFRPTSSNRRIGTRITSSEPLVAPKDSHSFRSYLDLIAQNIASGRGKSSTGDTDRHAATVVEG